jgi:hypothetical protein
MRGCICFGETTHTPYFQNNPLFNTRSRRWGFDRYTLGSDVVIVMPRVTSGRCIGVRPSSPSFSGGCRPWYWDLPCLALPRLSPLHPPSANLRRQGPSALDLQTSSPGEQSRLHKLLYFPTTPPSRRHRKQPRASRSRGSRRAKVPTRHPHYHPRFLHPSSLPFAFAIFEPRRSESNQSPRGGRDELARRAQFPTISSFVAFHLQPRFLHSAPCATFAMAFTRGGDAYLLGQERSP